MKKGLTIAAILLTMLAIFVNMNSNSDLWRNRYKNIFCKKLSRGIDKLFQPPSKYLTSNIKSRYVGKWNYFYLQKGEDAEFEIIKNFILDNYYTRNPGYKIKAIVQYQASHYGPDAMNPNFNSRPIFFIKETEENRISKFADLPDKFMNNAIPITFQDIVAQNLDTFLSSKLIYVSSVLLFLASIVSLYASLKEK